MGDGKDKKPIFPIRAKQQKNQNRIGFPIRLSTISCNILQESNLILYQIYVFNK